MLAIDRPDLPSGHQVLIGATVLDGEWIGEARDTLDM